MAEIGIVKFLKASHGKNRHQHNFKIEFIFKGKLDGDFVGGIDFHEVMPKIEEILSSVKERYLPDIKDIGRGTCENIACFLIKKLNHNNLHSVTVWEDVDRYTKIYKDEV